MIASFSDLGIDLPSIALIVLHSFVGSVMVQRLHKLSPLLSFMFVLFLSFISCRASEVEYLDLRSSRALISVVIGDVLIWCRRVCGGVMLL